MNGVFHRNSSVVRLYIKLISVEDCVRQEELGLEEYVLRTEEWMLEIIARKLDYGRESRKHYSTRRDNEREENLMNKPLHGQFFMEMDKLATDPTIQWVREGSLAKSTEAFVFAAQEQVIKTRLAQFQWGEGVSPLCRICGKEAESVWHISSACQVFAQRSIVEGMTGWVCGYIVSSALSKVIKKR